LLGKLVFRETSSTPFDRYEVSASGRSGPIPRAAPAFNLVKACLCLFLSVDGVGCVEAAAVQKHPAVLGDVAGRHLMLADCEVRRRQGCLAVRVERDRVS